MAPFKTNVSTTDYEQSSEYNEKLHYLRRSEGNWTTLRAGLVIAQPEKGVVSNGAGDDTVFVIAGEAHVTVEGSDEPIVLKPGDFVSFPRGLPQTWDIIEEFRAAFVYAE
jgi:uncharacterized cupin superfamily protein